MLLSVHDLQVGSSGPLYPHTLTHACNNYRYSMRPSVYGTTMRPSVYGTSMHEGEFPACMLHHYHDDPLYQIMPRGYTRPFNNNTEGTVCDFYYILVTLTIAACYTYILHACMLYTNITCDCMRSQVISLTIIIIRRPF